MIGLRNGLIIVCGLAALAGFLVLNRPVVSDGSNQRVPPVPVIATTDQGRVTPARTGSAPELPPGPDTTGRLRESLGIDELLDEVNADSGDGFTAVDRERFAALLRSDSQLREAIGD